jgi:hypothetical protein
MRKRKTDGVALSSGGGGAVNAINALREELLAELSRTQSDRLAALLPEFIEGPFESADSFSALLLPTKPESQWPRPEELSIIYGETLPLLYQSQAAIGTAEFVSGFSKGIATAALILAPQGQNILAQAVSQIIDPLLTGDESLPPVAPWLRHELLTTAKVICKSADIVNLRDMLAWNYGLWFAAVFLVAPAIDAQSKSALEWLRRVAQHFALRGVPPE